VFINRKLNHLPAQVLFRKIWAGEKID